MKLWQVGMLVVLWWCLVGVALPPPSLSLYAAAYCARGCELMPGDRFQVVLSVYTTSPPEAETVVSVNLADPLPPGLRWVSTTASGGGVEGLSWSGWLWAGSPATITHTLAVAEAGPVGEHLVGLGWFVTVARPDESVERRDASVVVRVGRLGRLYLPLLQRP